MFMNLLVYVRGSEVVMARGYVEPPLSLRAVEILSTWERISFMCCRYVLSASHSARLVDILG